MKQLTKQQKAQYNQELAVQSGIMKETLDKIDITKPHTLEWMEQDCKDMLQLLHTIFSLISEEGD